MNTEPCCELWAKAQEGGTDSEGYGSLVNHSSFDDSQTDRNAYMGLLPPVSFCPWCGTPKQKY